MPDPVDAVIVPQGKIVDFIDGTFRNETPEEYVRQEIEKSLVNEYEYPRARIAVEFVVKLGVARKRADLVVFSEGSDHKQEHIWAVLECKAASVSPNHRTDGVEQVKSYLAACVNAHFGIWTNGSERFCYRKLQSKDGIDFVEVNDMPINGRSIDDAEKPTPFTLVEATSDALLFTFRRCHNYIAGNQGLQKPEAFWELLKLIFCKIQDERGDDLLFYATTQERLTLNGQMKVKGRVDKLFNSVKGRFASIFKPNEVIELNPRVLAYIVSQLQAYSLLDSAVDVKGKAYEEIVGSNLRGDRGEFFTPRNVCAMAVGMADPSPEDLVLDPAMGTGGFLIVTMNHVVDKIRSAEQKKWKDPERPSEVEHRKLFERVQEYLTKRMVGIDLNPNLVKASKMNMVLNNDGSGGLYQANSLERPVMWEKTLRERDLLGTVDRLFTNPPFGSKIPIEDPAILEQYDLAHTWDYDEADDRYALRDPRSLVKSQPPEILFVERCVQFLKPGTGIMAIVLPDAILGAPGLAYVREWILMNTRVLASVDMHPDTFQPRNSTQTSLLVLQRKSPEEMAIEEASGIRPDYDVFLALANHVGHDKRGNTVYIRDPDGNELVQKKTERIRELHEDVPVHREVETQSKVVDDRTGDIVTAFKSWLSSAS